ncbi:MAG TPA: MarR family transcriptional regulator [Nocardioidaceae bacterium]|nr:MarR family transcriptional regulator [Nocardioidaceae bacterium]
MTGPEEQYVNLGLLMFVGYRSMESRVLEALHESGFEDMSAAKARVFERIGAQGTRLTDLAEQAQVTKQTAGSLVDQLEQAGYVERRPDPSDARARLICIAERGLAAVQVAAGVVAQVEEEWTQHLGERDARHLRRILTRLRETTDPYWRSGPG